MDPVTQLLVSREVEAASALRSMVVGATGILLGAGFALCVAFDLAAGPRARIEGAQETVGLVLAVAIAVLAGFSFVRGLVMREELQRGSDPVSVLLVSLVTVPLAALALGGYMHAYPPDKRLADPGLPYSFTYPGQWERDPDGDLPSDRGFYTAGVSKQVEGGVTEGVLVQVFEHDRPETLDESIRQQLVEQAFTIADEREVVLDGRAGFRIDFELPAGSPYGSHVMVRDGDEIYWITCVYKENSGRAKAGCDKVLETFEITGLTR
jgi:hypothetical protein